VTEKRQVFKCGKCGAIVAVLQGGKGTLTCCEAEMREVTPDDARKLSFDLQRPGAP
jgi:desulfoferrodoxin-like iron-binding protein